MKRTFFNSKGKDKQYIVIGCGRFGSSVAKKMCQLGNEVMVIDKDEDSIENIAEQVTHTAIVDVTEERDLKSIGLGNFDVVIVAISSDIRASIMVTIMAKEMGVPKIVCKAKDELQAKVLYKIGADKVVFPERDMGIRLAYNLASENILDQINLDPEYSIMEIVTPTNWVGKTIIELNLRAKYDITVLAVKTPSGLKEHRDFLIELENKGIKVYKTLNKIFSEMVDTENTQGILAVLEYKERDLVNNINQDDKFVLILDRIQDPGNMGTIIRTADSAGVDAVILLKGCVDIYNPKVIRSTMGSIFDMNIIHATQDDAVNFLKSNDFNIVSSYLQTDNYYHETTYDGKIALVIGNEANGINDELIAQSDKLVKIPIYGNAESLNAAISAAVLMYEIKKYLS